MYRLGNSLDAASLRIMILQADVDGMPIRVAWQSERERERDGQLQDWHRFTSIP